MIKKYFAMTIIAASISLAACSDDDDDDVAPPAPTPDTDMNPPAGPGGDPAPGPAPVAATPGVGGTAFDTIANSPDHTDLATAVTNAGLADALDAGEFTIFAPTNAAFAALTETPSDEELARILQYHVVSGTQDSTALSTLLTNNADPTVPVTLDTILVDGTGTDAVTQTLELGASDTASTGIEVNAVPVALADVVLRGTDEDETAVPASGVVHSIDSILMPPAAPDVAPPAPGGGTPPTAGGGDSTGVQASLEGFGNYTGFIGLSNSIGIQSFDTNAWTVFAPTDEAIAADTATGDLDIQDHVAVSGALAPAALLAAGTVTTNGGKSYTVTGTEAALMVDGKAVSVIATGAGGAQIYTIDGTLR